MRNISARIMIGIISGYALVAVLGVNQYAWATIDSSAHWDVRVAEKWNPVYGNISGITVEDGDSVGMFDEAGNCYGAGLIRGGRYFLSAFQYEDASLDSPDDFSIPGFREGDKVVFRLYSESTASTYILEPSGGEYVFTPNSDIYPPERIDLVYRQGGDNGGDGTGGDNGGDGTGGEAGGDNGDDNESGSIVPSDTITTGGTYYAPDEDDSTLGGGLEADEGGTSKTAKTTEKSEVVRKAQSGEDAGETGRRTSRREPSQDYYPEESYYPSQPGGTSSGRRSSTVSRRTGDWKDPNYDVLYQEKAGDETDDDVAAGAVGKEDRGEVTAEKDRAVGGKKSIWPLVILVLLLLAGAGGVIYALRRYRVL